MSSKQADADLILKLYDLRREPVMREARNWFVAEFHPASAKEIMETFLADKSAYLRMVTSYWEMAAALVNNGAIDEKMFNDCNGEHIATFCKLSPYLAELRAMVGMPDMLDELEKLVMRIPNAEEVMAGMRERFKQMAEARRAMAAAGS